MKLTCPCGAAELSIDGDAIVHFYCHCADCQRSHGAAYVPEIIFPVAAVNLVRGETLELKLKATPRYSCAKCGTRLFAHLEEPGLRGVSAALFPPGYFKPVLHIHCESAVAPVKDGLPHFKTMPAMFGGEDVMVEW